MVKRVTRKLVFDAAERRRIGKCCQVLGIYFEDFAHVAIMEKVDEVLGLNDEAYRSRAEMPRNAYGRVNGYPDGIVAQNSDRG